MHNASPFFLKASNDLFSSQKKRSGRSHPDEGEKNKKRGAIIVVASRFLPAAQLLPVADDVLGAEPLVGGQRDKTKVHMGRSLVHMHHCGDHGLLRLMFAEKVQRFLKESPDFFYAFVFEELCTKRTKCTWVRMVRLVHTFWSRWRFLRIAPLKQLNTVETLCTLPNPESG